ncbi:r2r3-MYB transcription factor [Tritrichomonas foetus]|uniref:R2r3-MYB transcription factor n=1 Tax=Tritrichomonas foetus TaxID=1144522 RepID=A0A1J4KDN9_9EUKA|nr:r2r3-MYB transcription factor [Tritrichomonas foetus]|eukprot:OHT09032.1 r2r3-MYB transcription factor [Tritrichomonas foetus]
MFAHQIPPNTPLYNIFNQQQQQQHQYYQHVLFNQQNQNFIPNTCTQSNNQISVINPNLMYNNIINNDFNTCNAFNSVSNNNSVIDNKNCFQPKIKHVILVNSKCKQAKKSKWTNEEDELLRDAVHEHGEHSWKTIATMVPGRNSKQCRERWTAQLNPCLTREEWSSEEDCVLLQMHTVHGNLWAKISTCLQGRSSSAVKNRYNWLMRRNMPQRMMSSFNHPYIGSVKASTESKKYQSI